MGLFANISGIFLVVLCSLTKWNYPASLLACYQHRYGCCYYNLSDVTEHMLTSVDKDTQTYKEVQALRKEISYEVEFRLNGYIYGVLWKTLSNSLCITISLRNNIKICDTHEMCAVYAQLILACVPPCCFYWRYLNFSNYHISLEPVNALISELNLMHVLRTTPYYQKTCAQFLDMCVI